MKSESDNTAHHICVDRGRSSATEPPSDTGNEPSYDRGSALEDQTNAQTADDFTHRLQTQNEFLYAMKEDLCDWLGALYGVDIGADEFWEKLETGVLLCRHANAVHDRLCHKTQTDRSASHITKDSRK